MFRFLHSLACSLGSIVDLVIAMFRDGLRFCRLTVRSRTALSAEILFLQSIVACDFLIVVSARFHILCIFLVMEVGTRRILHSRATAHPTAEWTLQQIREAIPRDHAYHLLIRDRDSIFSMDVDEHLGALGLKVFRTPAHAPKANAYLERLVGAVRRECLDFIIPLGEKQLGRILSEWVTHYNQGRPHLILGPGIPESAEIVRLSRNRHRRSLKEHCRVAVRAILGGGITHTGWKGLGLES